MRPRQKSKSFTELLQLYLKIPAPRLKEDPRIYLIPNFLSDELLESINVFLLKNENKFRPSFTEDEKGKKIVSSDRTSTFLPFEDLVIVPQIKKKIAELIGTDIGKIETMQVSSFFVPSLTTLVYRLSPIREVKVSIFTMTQVRSWMEMSSLLVKRSDCLLFYYTSMTHQTKSG